MYALNSALIQMTLRRIVLNSETQLASILSEQRIGASDLLWLHMLSKRRLEALDALPVSLFRINYRSMDVGRLGIDDEVFESACIRLSMIMETVAFSVTNKTNSLITIGFDTDAFDRFRSEPFLKRLLLIQRGDFSVGTRCDLKSLELNPKDKDSQLRDCIRIILGDYKYLSKHKPKALGRIRDWNLEMMGAETIATNLLKEGVTPKLVIAHVGLPEKVTSIHRKLRREHLVMPKGGGRIGTHSIPIERSPFHAMLFLAIYVMLANQPMNHINGFGFTRSLREYKLICGYLGMTEDDMLDASECWLVASGYRAQDVTLDSCMNCKTMTILDRKASSRCTWCGHQQA